MCEDPCDKLKYSVCQYEKGCDGPFLMPCSSTCFEFNNHWPERQPVNYTDEIYTAYCLRQPILNNWKPQEA